MTKGWLVLLETRDVSDGFMHKDFFAAAIPDKEEALKTVADRESTTPDQSLSLEKELDGADIAALGLIEGQVVQVPVD